MSVWDPKFRYTPSFDTDISKRFKKEQKRLEEKRQREAEEAKRITDEQEEKVQQIPQRRTK